MKKKNIHYCLNYALNRINTLTSIYNAGHGWLGASLSVAEIITNLYFDCADIKTINSPKRDYILLSKGHAAVMQYSALAGRGFFNTEDLLKYKQYDGLQAHTDIKTPGIEINSGSLGQTLSKACGLAMKSKNNIFVILGDGELQEGQNYEAFMTIVNYNLHNVIPIIDKNNIQSDSNVRDIKSIKNLYYVLCGFGFDVYNVNGNNIEQTNKIFWKLKKTEKPSIIIANTSKGSGISFMQSSDSSRRQYSWHSSIPNELEYIAGLQELSGSVYQKKIKSELLKFISEYENKKSEKSDCGFPEKKKELSTGFSFSKYIVEKAEQNSNLYCLDADLEKSCKLTEFALRFPARFIEMGIAEQDMISVAGGLALKGKIPVVNTYASFYRRGYEQIYVNCSEGKKIIYAGHYSGLCYATDGKTHQCAGDVCMMRGLPDMYVFHPSFNEEVKQIINWYLKLNTNKSIYFKLHRTPVTESSFFKSKIKFKFGWGIQVYKTDNHFPEKNICILTSGPHLTLFCSQAAEILHNKKLVNADVYSVSTLRYLDLKFVKELCTKYDTIFIIEENYFSGGLFDEVNNRISDLLNNESHIIIPRIFHKAVEGFSFSTLEQFGLYKYFGVDKEGIIKFILSGKLR
ncbi:hypothetical protein KA977_11645 [Candidatus Dependentiae bacterium]|nr:hypothetical protein [Candidatus Dependentiae bacterium]